MQIGFVYDACQSAHNDVWMFCCFCHTTTLYYTTYVRAYINMYIGKKPLSTVNTELSIFVVVVVF